MAYRQGCFPMHCFSPFLSWNFYNGFLNILGKGFLPGWVNKADPWGACVPGGLRQDALSPSVPLRFGNGMFPRAARQKLQLCGKFNRKLLFQSTSWMHFHDTGFMQSVCLCCSLCDRVSGVIWKEWGHQAPEVHRAIPSSSTPLL